MKKILYLLLISTIPFLNCGGSRNFDPVSFNLTEDAETMTPGHAGMNPGSEKKLTIGNLSVKMNYVPGGSFVMGDSSFGYSIPLHEVTITKGFYMAQREVSTILLEEVFNKALEEKQILINDEYVWIAPGTILLDLRSEHSLVSHNSGKLEVRKGMESYPASFISWYGALFFCNLLSRCQGLDPVYNISDWSMDMEKRGYRLPTEAEWEYAARYVDGNIFTTGNRPSGAFDDNQENFFSWHEGNSDNSINNINHGRGSHSTGLKLPNSIGLYDVSGNNLEWCWDRPMSYLVDEVTDPTGSLSGENRVIRGGCWQFGALYCSTSFRRWLPSSFMGSDIGLRFILPVE